MNHQLNRNILGRVFAMLMFFGFSMLPMMYIASFFFTIPSSGYTRMTLINIFLGTNYLDACIRHIILMYFIGVAAFMVVQVLSVEELDLTHVADGLHWGFLLVPHYALAQAMYTVSLIYSTHSLCNTVNEIGDSILNGTNLPGLGSIDYACLIQPERCCG